MMRVLKQYYNIVRTVKQGIKGLGEGCCSSLSTFYDGKYANYVRSNEHTKDFLSASKLYCNPHGRISI
jgi:hypothetical protein